MIIEKTTTKQYQSIFSLLDHEGNNDIPKWLYFNQGRNSQKKWNIKYQMSYDNKTIEMENPRQKELSKMIFKHAVLHKKPSFPALTFLLQVSFVVLSRFLFDL